MAFSNRYRWVAAALECAAALGLAAALAGCGAIAGATSRGPTLRAYVVRAAEQTSPH